MFIVFEGIDGSGKSTQIFLLGKYLSSLNKYTHILLTREPFKNREIRHILRLDEPAETKSEMLTDLFIQDRREHIQKMILPNLIQDVIVISDRYKYATMAYQSAQGQDISHLIDIQKYLPTPDFIFIIDVPVDVSSDRMNNLSRESRQKFEKSREFQNKVRENYLKLKELLPKENIIIIDGTKNIEEVFEQIKSFLKV